MKSATVLSIQGEQIRQSAARQPADQSFVDAYARKCSDGVARCRGRHWHNYPPIPRKGIRFNLVRADGTLVRFEVCGDCGCGVQVQVWEAYIVKHRGKEDEVRVRHIGNTTTYQENEHGEVYITMGHGHISTKSFREALATQSLDDEVMVEVRKALRNAAAAKRKASKSASRAKASDGA